MKLRLLAASALLFAFVGSAEAAPFPAISQDVGVCDPNAPTHCIAPDASGNVPITGTITASLGGFTPSASGARMTPITVLTADTSGTLPTGAVTVVSNVGTTNPMYCNVNGIAATTSDQLIGPNSWFAFTIPSGVTTLHCIATGGSTTANGVGGAGLPTGAGGGSSSGGGGGTVTQGNAGTNAQAWWVQIGDGTNGPAAVVTAGANGASNTANGLLTYNRNLVFNGTTWDRWTGAVTVASPVQVVGPTAVGSAAANPPALFGGTANGAATGNVAVATVRPGNAAGTTDPAVVVSDPNVVAAINSAVPYSVNGTPTAATALTPGGSQTGTIIAPNSDQTSLGGVAYGAMANFGTSPGAVKSPNANAFNFVTDQVGGGPAALEGDPCQTTAKTTLPITLATAAVKVIATGVSGKKIYVCQIYLNNNAADSVAVFEATTGTTCATSPIAVIGGGTSVATAASGNNWAANGGLSQGNGQSQVLVTTVNNNDLCVAQSAATQLTGSITYVTR